VHNASYHSTVLKISTKREYDVKRVVTGTSTGGTCAVPYRSIDLLIDHDLSVFVVMNELHLG
jgi:hypothetical protein